MMQIPHKKKTLANKSLILRVKTKMACVEETDDEKKIVKFLKEVSVKNCTDVATKQPSSAAEILGSDVSLVRDVAVKPINAFICVLLFRSRILFLHVVSERNREKEGSGEKLISTDIDKSGRGDK